MFLLLKMKFKFKTNFSEFQDSSLPLCLFVWDVENTGTAELEVSLTFTFRNGTGDSRWNSEAECNEERFQESTSDNDDDVIKICGMTLDHRINGMRCKYTLATKEKVSGVISSSEQKSCAGEGKFGGRDK